MHLSCVLRMKDTTIDYHSRTGLNTPSGLFEDRASLDLKSLCRVDCMEHQ